MCQSTAPGSRDEEHESASETPRTRTHLAKPRGFSFSEGSHVRRSLRPAAQGALVTRNPAARHREKAATTARNQDPNYNRKECMASHKPETLVQAQEWERTKNHYLKLGLCTTCAPQASWGHQNGFSSCRPPCRCCEAVVGGFPTKEAGSWRSLGRRLGRKGARTEGHSGAV